MYQMGITSLMMNNNNLHMKKQVTYKKVKNIDVSFHNQASDEEPFINLADSTSSGSSDVIITHTSTLQRDVNKKFWDRLAGIYINLELFNYL